MKAIANGNPKAPGLNGAYAWYVLFVLMIAYILNYVDRSILSILAEDVKRHLSITDTQLGFLYGTAFGIFYALFGYPIGRLVDRCRRIPVLAVGLLLWSVMTCLSGISGSLGQLALMRVGVGVGEASLQPTAYSLLSDWFSREKRGGAIGIYTAGLFIGSGSSFAIGGAIVSAWDHAFPAGGAPFGLAGWQAAFLAVGLPGFFLAAWVLTLREPTRGMADGIAAPVQTGILASFIGDISAVVPPLTLIDAWRGGIASFARNIAAALVCAAASWVAIRLSGDVAQWSAIGVGCYAVFSARESLRRKDGPTYALTWGTPAFWLATLGFSLIAMCNAAVAFWVAPLSLRTFAADKATTGLILGIVQAGGGLMGVIMGGKLSDILIRVTPLGRIYVGMIAAIVPAPFIIAMTMTGSQPIFYLCLLPVFLVGCCYVPVGTVISQELVLPRMRGTATALYFVCMTILSLGLGPYTAGKISTASGNLGAGLRWILLAEPIALLCLILSARSLRSAEATKLQRATAMGEELLLS